MSTGIQLLGFLLSVGGWLATLACLMNSYWKVSTDYDQLITTTNYYENLWKTCVQDSTGRTNCQNFNTLLNLEGYIQGTRALMILSLVVSLIGVITALFGMKCITIGSSDEQTKGKMSVTSGTLFIVGGICSLAAVSWYAAQVIQQFYSAIHGKSRYELGSGLYIGWAGSVLAILGGIFLCCSFKKSRKSSPRAYKYSAPSNEQKIYKPTSQADKAYV
ncbi:claudin 15-like b isoform X2 [Erpetoichthys calabaricus]|uniref:claudin 15-like b isoform X2 n=1 Tax=Erpetoichthys calabaricus TaxID=27687 RepID=UPI0022343146|nr:claudin 15-like b isoform X2 [Erpetoichthys calabaricus]